MDNQQILDAELVPKKIVDFRTTAYFSWQFQLFAAFMLLLGLSALLSSGFISGGVMLVIAVIIFTTHYRLRVDLTRKVYMDYLWFLGLRNGKRRKFNEVDYLFIKRSKESQKMYHITISTTVYDEVFDAYLRFSERDKVHLFSSRNKAKLLKRLGAIAPSMRLKIVDYTLEESINT